MEMHTRPSGYTERDIFNRVSQTHCHTASSRLQLYVSDLCDSPLGCHISDVNLQVGGDCG